MIYVPPFEFIKKIANVSVHNGTPHASIDYEGLLGIIKLFLRTVPVNEEWYRNHYKDVSLAIASGKYNSAKHHFVENGYFEGRIPSKLEINEGWYIKNNPDIAECIEFGVIASGLEHFERDGYIEGRSPAEF